MSTQPNALRLANAHESDPKRKLDWCRDARSELRAQHELIQTLKAALDGALALSVGHACSYQLNHELSEWHPTHQEIIEAARAALAAAEAHK